MARVIINNMSDWNWVEATIALKKDHEETWREKSDLYWLWRLILEIRELVASLLGVHKDKPEWELMQIAAICMNWLEKRDT